MQINKACNTCDRICPFKAVPTNYRRFACPTLAREVLQEISTRNRAAYADDIPKPIIVDNKVLWTEREKKSRLN